MPKGSKRNEPLLVIVSLFEVCCKRISIISCPVHMIPGWCIWNLDNLNRSKFDSKDIRDRPCPMSEHRQSQMAESCKYAVRPMLLPLRCAVFISHYGSKTTGQMQNMFIILYIYYIFIVNQFNCSCHSDLTTL